MVASPSSHWQLRSRTLELGPLPCLMGIINVTPDSFSDGGQFLDPRQAVEQGLQLAEAGAGILDVGGESTRPGSHPVEQSEEMDRVLPVVEELCRQLEIPVSIDTSKAEVARQALQLGAEIINDVTGLEGDAEMIDVARQQGAGICAMHMQGNPLTMQVDPRYHDVVADVSRYLADRRDALLAAGIEHSRICLDPGIGFGKTHEHNLELIRQCRQFHQLGCPLLVGHSAKGFIASVLGDKELDRTSGTVGVALWLAQQGIQVIRVHDVAAVQQALLLFAASGGLEGPG
jgi:dihydropteroate synthase